MEELVACDQSDRIRLLSIIREVWMTGLDELATDLFGGNCSDVWKASEKTGQNRVWYICNIEY